MSSSLNAYDWFAQLENIEDDPILLQEFVGDCLLDYSPDSMAGLMDDPELHSYTLSAGSGSNSPTPTPAPTATATATAFTPPTENYLSPPTDEQPKKRSRGGTSSSTKRPRREPDECHNHIIAERQRRQNLSQRFIALSALIPGLKKMDKTSVLGEAITHMKELKEKLRVLEEENARKAAVDTTVVVVKRSGVRRVENECHSSGSSSCLTTIDEQRRLPEIETRFYETNVLIKIHCEMQTGVLSRIISEIENQSLIVTSTSSMPFNNTTLDINILTQMEPDFDLRPHEVVANLRSIF